MDTQTERSKRPKYVNQIDRQTNFQNLVPLELTPDTSNICLFSNALYINSKMIKRVREIT